MSIHHTINAVLATSNLQQMDGYCVCASCNRDDLDRNQIVPDGHVNAPLLAEYVERFDGAICWDCYDYTDPRSQGPTSLLDTSNAAHAPIP